MATAQVLMDRALRSLGALALGASAASSMQSEGLAVLNTLIDRTQADGLMIPQILQTSKTLTSGDGDYTVGTSQDINIARPLDIQDTSFLHFNGQDYPLEKIDRQRYNAIGAKSSQGMPTQVFYDDRFPVGYLYLYPVPDQAYELRLDYLAPITAYATAGTDQNLPPAAESFLWTNLALDLWPFYPNERVLAAVTRAAATSRIAFAKTNVRVPILQTDFRGRRG